MPAVRQQPVVPRARVLGAGRLRHWGAAVGRAGDRATPSATARSAGPDAYERCVAPRACPGPWSSSTPSWPTRRPAPARCGWAWDYRSASVLYSLGGNRCGLGAGPHQPGDAGRPGGRGRADRRGQRLPRQFFNPLLSIWPVTRAPVRAVQGPGRGWTPTRLSGSTPRPAALRRTQRGSAPRRTRAADRRPRRAPTGRATGRAPSARACSARPQRPGRPSAGRSRSEHQDQHVAHGDAHGDFADRRAPWG